MSLTFTASSWVGRTTVTRRIDICGWSPSRPLKTRSIRRATITTRGCAAVGDGNDKPEERTSKQTPDEEQPLDEAAMRAAEIHEVLTGLRDFKNRIIEDATKLAKKVRAPKKQLEAALASHPDIIKIDGHIADLEEELKILGDR